MEIDDGSDKPIGFVSADGELEVRETDGERCYHETELGQHQRWMRQAPDLFELYMTAREHNRALLAKFADQAGNVSVPAQRSERVNSERSAKDNITDSPLPLSGAVEQARQGLWMAIDEYVDFGDTMNAVDHNIDALIASVSAQQGQDSKLTVLKNLWHWLDQQDDCGDSGALAAYDAMEAHINGEMDALDSSVLNDLSRQPTYSEQAQTIERLREALRETLRVTDANVYQTVGEYVSKRSQLRAKIEVLLAEVASSSVSPVTDPPQEK